LSKDSAEWMETRLTVAAKDAKVTSGAQLQGSRDTAAEEPSDLKKPRQVRLHW
jgi:hypothetical protein